MTAGEELVVQEALCILQRELSNRCVGPSIYGTQRLLDYLRMNYSLETQEIFGCIYLNPKLQIIKHEVLFRGTVDNCATYPRELVKAVLHHNAVGVILVHNHPSGDSKPSIADLELTRTVTTILKSIGVRLHDHVIMAGGQCYSMIENGDF